MTQPSTEITKILAPSNTKAKLGDLLRIVAPAERKADVVLRKVALPKKISDETRASLAILPVVYGKVAPAEPRELTDEEMVDLLVERKALNDVITTAEKRKDDQKVIMHNHFDAVITKGLTPEQIAALGLPIHPENGFYITDEKATPVAGQAERFVRETSEGAPSLSEKLLLDMVEEGTLDKSDYLAMTRQVRVLDENRVLDTLRKKPALVDAIGKATVSGKLNASITTRKAT